MVPGHVCPVDSGITPSQSSKTNAKPFFELIAQMETLLETIELDWPEDMRTDAKRRLARIARALRYAPETRERLLNVT
jgi:hypothetical protein